MEKESKEVASKFAYYLGVVIAIGNIIFFGVLLELILKKPNNDIPMILYCLISPYSFYLFYINTSKSIYASIDLQSGNLFYGNLFFNRQINLKDVKVLKKKFLARNTYMIKIGDKKYELTTSLPDFKEYLRTQAA